MEGRRTVEIRSAIDEARILVDSWVDMWNAYDLNRVRDLFLVDESLSYFSSEREGAFFGIGAVEDHHLGFGFVPGGKVQPNKLWLEDLRFFAHGDAVVVTGIWYFQPLSRSSMWGPVTFVCTPGGGQRYRFSHVNFGNYG